MCSPGFLLASSPGIWAVGTGRSHMRSALPAWIWASAVALDDVPSVTTTWLTYWCLIRSVDCFQAGFLLSTIFLVAVYEVIAYGPSESVCCRNAALSGRYLSYSAGLGDANGMARMLRKSLAGWVSLKLMVIELGVPMPEIACVFWKLASAAAVGAEEFLKAAV